MFKVNTDLSIEITRGDAVEFIVTAQENGENYVFKNGDIVRFKVFEKKGCDCVVLQKDFGVESDTEEVTIVLEEADTKIGELIHKPKDYWYEVELNPDTLPYTIIGYDADGAKVFKLYPEGRDLGADPITPEDIPFVDKELDMTSHNPVENQTIVKEFDKVNDRIQQNADAVAQELANKLSTSGGTMVGNLSMGSKKLTGLTDPENDSDAVPLGYAKRAYVPKSHLEDNENPHNVTAEQVGARPNTWMPTANDVGARSNTWMPTASDVGARPDTWMPTANEVGARPSTWTPTASEVGARADTWTPTAAEVGARPDDWMPTASDVGAAKSSHNHAASNITSGTLSTDRLPTVPFEKGGLGGTDRLSSAKNLTNESISSPGYVVSLTGSWENFGYTTLAQLRTALGIKDYVTAQGKSGNWHYRKYNSGYCECWRSITEQVTASQWEAWGGIYLTPGISVGAFPFSVYSAVPNVTAHNAGNNTLGVVTASDVSATTMNEVRCFRGTKPSSTITVVYNIFVCGKWKE